MTSDEKLRRLERDFAAGDPMSGALLVIERLRRGGAGLARVTGRQVIELADSYTSWLDDHTAVRVEEVADFWGRQDAYDGSGAGGEWVVRLACGEWALLSRSGTSGYCETCWSPSDDRVYYRGPLEGLAIELSDDFVRKLLGAGVPCQ